ncbi:MAG: DUF3810 family protein, partial [Acidobacteriota bacterium]|nr:DUF3810 family protein [Acidobacteriota bacterium]
IVPAFGFRSGNRIPVNWYPSHCNWTAHLPSICAFAFSHCAEEHWQQFEGHASRTTRSMNNAYLRTNRVPGGILSYNRSVKLLIGYARSRGGRLINP